MSWRVMRTATPLAVAVFGFGVILAVGAAVGSARSSARLAAHASHGGPLSGVWSGEISRDTSYGVSRQQMTITINARETGGTWKISAACYGRETLDSISNGYHHYLRHVAAGATCTGGDIDCLKRAGANLYDSVTSHLGGGWDRYGTLKRVRGAA